MNLYLYISICPQYNKNFQKNWRLDYIQGYLRMPVLFAAPSVFTSVTTTGPLFWIRMPSSSFFSLDSVTQRYLQKEPNIYLEHL